jgi:hypothetical protein
MGLRNGTAAAWDFTAALHIKRLFGGLVTVVTNRKHDPPAAAAGDQE